MKFFFIALGLALGVWWWMRKQSGSAARSEPPKAPVRPTSPAPTSTPLLMAQCAVCGVHLPRSDALPGPNGQGYYCSAAHRQRDDG